MKRTLHQPCLAGSGTSLGNVQGPSMTNLWEAIAHDQNNLKISDKMKKISALVNYNISENNNIEEFLSQCEAFLSLGKNIDDVWDVSDFVIDCKKIILSKCSFSMEKSRLKGHTTFLHRLSKRRVRDSRLKLFTTNYDLCFETAAAYQGLVVLDGFSFTQPRYYDPSFFSYDIVRRPKNGENHGNYLEGVIQLYKLHGSVDWEFNEEKKIAIKEKPNKPCLIYPAKGKYQQSYIQPHLELISQFFTSLREPNTCFIVSGFGFNDDHLSEPIFSAIKSNPHMRLIVVDYCAEKNCDKETGKTPWKKLHKLSESGDDVWIINASFEEFSKLIPNLQSLNKFEKLGRDISSLAGEK